ncbi:hypothetical protein [Paenibacillus terrae]|nr:hypothetical protein [Paenibacillus terrae]
MQIVVSNFDFLKPVFDFELFKVAHQDKEDVKANRYSSYLGIGVELHK